MPQPSPSPAPENSNSKEYEGQTSPKAGTINNNIPINSSKDISITTPENAEEKDTNEIEDEELFGRPALKKTETKKEETSIEFEMRQKGILKDSPFK